MIILRQKNYSSMKPGFLGELEMLADKANRKYPNQRSLVFEVVYRPNHPMTRAQILLGIESEVFLEIEYTTLGKIIKVGGKEIQEAGIKDELMKILKEIEKSNPEVKEKAAFLYSDINRFKV